MRRFPALATIFFFLPLTFAAAGSTNGPLLSIDRIFDSNEFDGPAISEFIWSKNRGYYCLEKSTNVNNGKDLVWRNPRDGASEIILPAHAFTIPGGGGPLAIESFTLSPDESRLLIFTNGKRVWRANTRGDYWVMDITSRELRKLGADAAPSTLMFAKFSPDGKNVAYVRENNIHVQNLRDMSVTALTESGSPTLVNGTFDWVYEEELSLRDGYEWSPDSSSIAYWQLDVSGVREFRILNNTDAFYPSELLIPYPKTGEQNSAARIGVISMNGGETVWMTIPGDPRNNYLARMSWASNSTELLIQQFNRTQDTNTVWLADARSGESQAVLTETDDAWVENENSIHWIDSGRSFLWLSERTSWRQIYRVARDGSEMVRLTEDEFDVIDLKAVDEHNGWIYYSASPQNATELYLYRVSIEGGNGERITPEATAGMHSYKISPDAAWAVHSFSAFTNPPVVTLVQLPSHERVRAIEDSGELQKKLRALDAPITEFFQVEIEPGVELDAWCIKPPQFSESNKFPLLIYVYGEPAGQTVLNRWAGKRQLWHWMLAQQGYIVISIDNRGTPAPKGRTWRKALHHRIGILNIADQAAALRVLLQQRPYLDPQRVAIWGWSGGGSSTLNAIFQFPNLYHTAMAVAPVPNQRYYDTIYQERYMGLPDTNPEGYRRGSPLTHARNLQGNLLVIHGTGDDNVHYQGTEALINELVAFNKPFTMMAYPNRSHGISEGKNTTRHLYSLLTRFLTWNMPAAISATGEQYASSDKQEARQE